MAALLIAAIAVLIYFLYYFVSNTNTYWAKKGIKGPKPMPVIGNMKTVILTREDNINTLVEKVYDDYPKESVVGMYQGPAPLLIVKDPELIKCVLIKDFNHFVDRGLRVGNDPITNHLFAADGDEWRTLRQKLSPIFTTGKLKGMMPLVKSCVDQFMVYLDTIADDKSPKDIRRLTMKYTMKTITSVAFGVEVDTFGDNLTEFEQAANKLFQPKGLRKLFGPLVFALPQLMEYLNVSSIDPEVAKFFLKLVREIVNDREGKPKVRNDFMDLIIELKEQGTVTRERDGKVAELEITHELITAQAMVFYVAGFETSSGTMSFMLYELAKNPEVQERCREEIDRVMIKHNGKLDFEALKELKYVTMALNETMRMYPVVPTLFRKCVQKYTFPKLNLTIDEGTKVYIPLRSIQMDSKYFPDPETFRPERGLEEQKDNYMPFGDGPRICIGNRFARVQATLGIAHFLHKFKVSACADTPKKIVFDPSAGLLGSRDIIYLNMERRT